MKFAADLDALFTAKPRARGKTPLKTNLEPVIQGYGSEENDTLILILTDGEPTDCTFDDLSKCIKSKPADVYCSFAMCTAGPHKGANFHVVLS